MTLTRRTIIEMTLAGIALAGCTNLPQTLAASQTEKTRSPEFDLSAARTNYLYALALNTHDEAVRDGYSGYAAQKYFRQMLPVDCVYTTINFDNKTSALIVHDFERKRIIVSLNTHYNLPAILNDVKFWPHSHPLGGSVHSGFYTSILEPDKTGQNLAEKIKQVITGYAGDTKSTIPVDLVGFSRGGSLAVATAAQWISEGFPFSGSNIKLASIYTFGSPAFGDKIFNARFAEESRKIGLQMIRVVGAGDPMPKHMTKEAWYPYLGTTYAHVGTSVYLFPAQDESKTKYVVDPSDNELRQLMSTLKHNTVHDENVYADLLGVPKAKSAPLPPRPEDRERKPPASAPSYQ